MTETKDRARNRLSAQFICRLCGCNEVRHFLSVDDYNHDIRIQNLLCLRCYIEEKYDPAAFVSHEQLPVMPYPEFPSC